MLEMRGRRGTAILMARSGAAWDSAGVESRLALSSAGSSRAASNQGTRPNAAHPVFSSMIALASSKSVASPRNLLTTKPLRERAFGRRQQRPCADQARDHAAAVHVPHQRHGHAGGAREAHVGDVVLPQVDLGRAAGAFHQDQVGAVPSRPKLSSTRGMSPALSAW